MLKTLLVGKVINQDAEMIVMQEDDGVATYSKRFFRLPHDQDKAGEPVAITWTDPLPVEMTYGLHGILAPVTA